MAKSLPWITFPATREECEAAAERIQDLIDVARAKDSSAELRHALAHPASAYVRRFADGESRFWETLHDHLLALGDQKK